MMLFKHVKEILIIILIAILIGYGIINNLKYKKLQESFIELQSEYFDNNQLVEENKLLQKQIEQLESEIFIYQNEIDSLKLVKKEIIINKSFKESVDLTESVSLLKKNIQCER